MAAKVQIKNDSIYNFGGFYFCIDYFRKSGLAELTDNTLDIRGVLATYSYSEIVKRFTPRRIKIIWSNLVQRYFAQFGAYGLF